MDYQALKSVNSDIDSQNNMPNEGSKKQKKACFHITFLIVHF